MKKGDLSKFIEEAVRWRVFHRSVQDIEAQNASTSPDALHRIVDDAVREVRAERRTKRAHKARCALCSIPPGRTVNLRC